MMCLCNSNGYPRFSRYAFCQYCNIDKHALVTRATLICAISVITFPIDGHSPEFEFDLQYYTDIFHNKNSNEKSDLKKFVKKKANRSSWGWYSSLNSQQSYSTDPRRDVSSQSTYAEAFLRIVQDPGTRQYLRREDTLSAVQASVVDMELLDVYESGYDPQE